MEVYDDIYRYIASIDATSFFAETIVDVILYLFSIGSINCDREGLPFLYGFLRLAPNDYNFLRSHLAIVLCGIPELVKDAFDYISHVNACDPTGPQCAFGGDHLLPNEADIGDDLWDGLEPSLLPHFDSVSGDSIAPALDLLGPVVLVRLLALQATELDLSFKAFFLGAYRSTLDFGPLYTTPQC